RRYYLIGLVKRQHHDGATHGAIQRTVNRPAALLDAADQVVGEVARALADALDADLQHDIHRRARREDRRRRGCPRLQTLRVLTVLELRRLELELVTRGPPARHRWFELRD